MTAMVLGAAGLGAGNSDGGSVEQLFVYNGNAALNEGYNNFAAHTRLQLVQNAVLPADLAPFKCVVLPINQALFSDAQKQILSAYVNGGGNLFGIGDHDGFAGSHATFNDLGAFMGSGITIGGGVIDGGFHTTENVRVNALTDDVEQVRYAALSEVLVAGNGEGLIESEGGILFIASEEIGNGRWVVSGDSNVFSDNSEQGYANFDNGVFVANLCNPAVTTKTVADALIVRVDMNPAVNFPAVKAVLTNADTGEPLAGARIMFATKVQPICSAVTNAQGMASCGNAVSAALVIRDLGYTATFAGGPGLKRSSDFGPLVDVLGNEILPPM